MTYRRPDGTVAPYYDPARKRRAASRYVTCPLCGRQAAVRSGRIFYHAPRLGIGNTECPGTGMEAP